MDPVQGVEDGRPRRASVSRCLGLKPGGPARRGSPIRPTGSSREGGEMRRLLGIDLAITAESRACVTDDTGAVLHERRFRIRRNELEALYDKVTEGMSDGDALVVVMEPTSSSWIAP